MKPLRLYQYQRDGADFLASRKVAILADEQGVGKSAQAITAADQLGAKRILVVCRAVGRANWRNEFEKFGKIPRSVAVVFSGRDIAIGLGADVVVSSYEHVGALLAHAGRVHNFVPFDVVIVDEAHYVKNPATKRAKQILGTEGLIHKCKRMWLLTGTPAPNNASEMWPWLFVFGATKLSHNDFTNRFCHVRKTTFGDQITGTKTDKKSIDDLRSIMKSVLLRRTKEDVNLNLKAISYGTLIVPAGKVNLSEHFGFFKWAFPHDRTEDLVALLEKELGVLDGILEDKTLSKELMSVLMASAKSISTLRRYTALQKLQATADLVRDEMSSGQYDKLVIFAIHRDCINGLQLRLKDFGAVTLYGGSNPLTVEKNLRRFQDPESRVRIMICNIQAAGTSITLTAANQVIFLEHSWVPGENAQAAARCHRIGQTRPVFVRNIVLPDSIDQKVIELIQRKTAEISHMLDGKDMPLGLEALI